MLGRYRYRRIGCETIANLFRDVHKIPETHALPQLQCLQDCKLVTNPSLPVINGHVGCRVFGVCESRCGITVMFMRKLETLVVDINHICNVITYIVTYYEWFFRESSVNIRFV